MINVDQSDRLKALPPYLFIRLDKMKAEARAKGVDVIDLGIGDPDQPTPAHIIEAMKQALDDPANHRYPSTAGLKAFQEATAGYMARRFKVKIDPKTVISLIGSKEGIAHFPLAYLNVGDTALVPSPAYPVYRIGTLFAGGRSYTMGLEAERNFLPDLDAIPARVAQSAKIMFLNYPNNPTSAVADKAFFERAVAFAKKHEILILHDAAYAEIAFDGFKPPSILEVPGAFDCAVELHSLSKTFNMTGWRIGFAVGCPPAVAALSRVKSNIDSGVFQAVQMAAVEALERGEADISQIRALYQARRDVLTEGLESLGLEFKRPRASFYIWARVPSGYSSEEFVATLLEQAGIMSSPGVGYGPEGEGYFRLALIVGEDRMREACERMRKIKL
jgi:LL-diaminopimelate aminotransferase